MSMISTILKLASGPGGRISWRAGIATAILAASLCARGSSPLALEFGGFIPLEHAPLDEISAEERRSIWQAIDRWPHRHAKSGTQPKFIWPLRAARGYSKTGYHVMSYFVDHDAQLPSKLRDYMCGTRTYDRDNYNHLGTDISLFPDRWNLMAAGQIEVVAVARGVIVDRVDGEFDRNCATNNGSRANRVSVQHDDGSVAWYLHLKSGSVTQKSIGEEVTAGEYLGKVGSSGSSGGPHLHLEVYDADRRLIDPFKGQCNATTQDSWWQAQPAYQSPGIVAVATASSAPTAATCANGVLEQPGSNHERDAFAPGQVVYFLAAARDIPVGQAPTFRVRRPDGSLWGAATGGSAPEFRAGGQWWYSATLEANAPLGLWTLEAELDGSVSSATFAVTSNGLPADNYSDLWWNPAESGWGVNINHQADTLFATWFTYDIDGSAAWYVMSDAVRQPAGGFAGTIYRATGVSPTRVNNAPAITSLVAAGTGRFDFSSNTQGRFAYELAGVRQERAITRQKFSTQTVCSLVKTSRAGATNYQDLWWKSTESGWGLNIAHQGDVLFATWFTYGADGRAQWLVASDARRQPTGEFRGTLYRTRGLPLAQINGAPAATEVLGVGEVTLSFRDGENGRLDYIVDGMASSKSITRQVFGSSQPLCR